MDSTRSERARRAPESDQHDEIAPARPARPASQPRHPALDRRRFLGGVGGVGGALLAARYGALSSLLGQPAYAQELAADCELGPVTGAARADRAYKIRNDAALYERSQPLPAHPCNGDEKLYPTKFASFSKALPHDDLGEVDLAAYTALTSALDTGSHAALEAVPLGGSAKLANPQAAYTYLLEGPDSHHLGIPAAPAFASAETAGEMGEVYWQALTRDVPFAEYANNALTQEAASDLSAFSDFRGPKEGGKVTPATLFRGPTPGDLTGPYVSQFLYKDVPYGATTIVQRYRTAAPDKDYMTSYDSWVAVQRGAAAGPTALAADPRYITTGRDLGQYVHVDWPYQSYLNTTLILLSLPGTLDAGNPYLTSRTQGGFVTFGAAHILDILGAGATLALEAAWYQKWLLHRRLRPEVFGGRIHNHVTNVKKYPIHDDILRSSALGRTHRKFGSYLLPQAYPEGSPTHPAYPAGHAVVAGACATLLKAFFDEDAVIPDPVEPSSDGGKLRNYSGTLKVGGELNKLASNISLGRDTAGVHYRSDGIEGLRLGEEAAIRLLTELRAVYSEPFAGFSLTRFDGTRITV